MPNGRRHSNHKNSTNCCQRFSSLCQWYGYSLVADSSYDNHDNSSYDNSNDIYIYITNVKKEQQRKECYNVTNVLNPLENHEIKYLLFAHAFTGFDITSAIHTVERLPYSGNSKIPLP